MKQFMNDHPLQAPVVLASVMLAAFGAKLGLGLWAVGGLVCFYPSYLALLVAGRAMHRMARGGISTGQQSQGDRDQCGDDYTLINAVQRGINEQVARTQKFIVHADHFPNR